MGKAKPEPSHTTNAPSFRKTRACLRTECSQEHSASENGIKGKAKVNRNDVKKVASVARLNLTDKELDKFSGELGKILEAFRELESIETTNVKPSFQPIPMANVLREDKNKPSLSQEKAIRNAKNRESGFIKGPRVV